MTKEEAIKILKDFHDKSALFSVRTALETLYPELKESEDEKIIKILQEGVNNVLQDQFCTNRGVSKEKVLSWLEKQGEQKPTQEIEPFEAEHGKYYYCIKDYFCGGRKQASKGDVVQALRGLPIMGLKDAGEYFLPVNSIKCNSAWGEEDEEIVEEMIEYLEELYNRNRFSLDELNDKERWLKSLRPQSQWKPSDEQMSDLWNMLCECRPADHQLLQDIYYGLKKLREE